MQNSNNALSYGNIFQSQVAKNTFYTHAKNSQAFQKPKVKALDMIDEDEGNRELENGYIESCTKDFSMPIPFFAKITNNGLKLKKEFVTDAQAHALSQYLINSNQLKLQQFKLFSQNQIQFLHLDDCGIKDAGFSEILKALLF